MPVVKVAVVQVAALPAYATRRADFAREPAPPDDDVKPFLAPIRGHAKVASLAEYITAAHLNDLQLKLTHALAFAATYKVDVVVLPEYAIPKELLPFLSTLARQHGMHIVAGSHLVSVSESALAHYRQLGFKFLAEDPSNFARRAMAVVLHPDGEASYRFKTRRSKWEPELNEWTQPQGPMTISTRGGSIAMDLRICIEALGDGVAAPADLFVVVSYTPSVTPFNNLFSQLVFNETACVFANSALVGGSSLRMNMSDDADGLKALLELPAPEEAVVIAEIDTAQQFQKKQSAKLSSPGRLLARAPLLYTCARDHAVAFEHLDELRSEPNRAGEIVGRILALRQIPHHMKQNLEIIQSAVQLGTQTKDDVALLAQAVPLPPACVPFDNRCTLALQLGIRYVADLLKDNPNSQPLSDAIAQLSIAQAQHNRKSLKLSEEPPAIDLFERQPPFLDRDSEHARLKAALQRDNVAVLAGLPGAGRSSIAARVLGELVPRSPVISVNLVSETTGDRLIRQIEEALELNLQTLASLSASRKKEYSAAVMIRNGEQLVAQDRDAFVRLRDLLSGTGIAVVICSTRQLDPMEHVRVGGLDHMYAERLYAYWCEAANVSPRPDLLRSLHGHPLAIKVAARRQQDGDTSALDNLRFLKQLRTELLQILFSGLKLSESEQETLRTLTLFRRPVPEELLSEFDDVDLLYLDSLEDRFLVERSADGVYVYPFVREVLREAPPGNSGRIAAIHKRAGEWFEAKLQRSKGLQRYEAREEAMYHYMAAGTLDKARKLGTDWLPEARSAAIELYKQRDYVRCLDVCEAILVQKPNSGDVLARAALCLAKQRRWTHAEDMMKKAFATRDVPPGLLIGYGETLAQSGAGSEAIRWLETICKDFPQVAYAHAALADAYFGQNEMDEAYRAAMDALNLDDENVKALCIAAKVAKSERDYERAHDFARRAMAVNPLEARQTTHKIITAIRRESGGSLPAWVDPSLENA